MRYSTAEKLEIIRLVEGSDLPVSRTLQELGVPRSSFYRWYACYQEAGPEGVESRRPTAKQFWNRVPDEVRQEVVDLALEQVEKSPRELAWTFTDRKKYYLSESTVYRILKQHDLITTPAYQVVTVADRFENPTRRVNEMWQTDFTQFKVHGWGWYYLCTVLDDFSRYIISWRLAPTMTTADAKATLDVALDKVSLHQIDIDQRPRLLSDNGASFVSQAMKEYLRPHHISHIRGAPYHPMTQGKIERYHRSLKNVVKLDTYYFPEHLRQAIDAFITYYNHERYHESLQNLTPATLFFGRDQQQLAQREVIKQETLKQRRLHHRQTTQNHVSYS